MRRYVRVKVRYPSPTAHFASLRLRTPTLERRRCASPRLPGTVYILHHDYIALYANRTTTTTLTKSSPKVQRRCRIGTKHSQRSPVACSSRRTRASLTRPPSAQLLPEPQVEKLCSACLDLIRSAPGWGWQPLWGLAVTSPLPATDPEHSKPGGAGVRGRALSGGSPRGACGAGAEPVRICRGLP